MTSRWYLERGGYPEKIFLNEHEMDLDVLDSTNHTIAPNDVQEMVSLAGTVSVVSLAPSVVDGMEQEMKEEPGQLELEIEERPQAAAPSSSSVALSVDSGSTLRKNRVDLTAASLNSTTSQTTGTLPPPRYLDPKYYCPICSRIFKHPIKCANGHTFCHSCLKHTVPIYIICTYSKFP